MHPDHVAALARMHAERLEQQARDARLTAGMRPRPLRHAIARSLRRRAAVRRLRRRLGFARSR